MNPADRNKKDLLAKTENLCNAIIDINTKDPWSGGDGYLSQILRAVRMQDISQNAAEQTWRGGPDYALSAQRELFIREQSAGLIRTAQEISSLIRTLQELWLFGGLDTLSDPADEEANRVKALAVAEMIEALSKRASVEEPKEDGEKRENGEEQGEA